MRLIAVGRLRPGPEADLLARYTVRLRPALTIVELPDGKGPPPVIKRQEASALLGALPPQALVVALDGGGAAIDSAGLARALERWGASGRPLCFLIGGAEGFDAAVVARADHVVSFGAMTWPHMLARVMLAEQLYRAQSILAGHPYHRAGRPEG